MNLSTCSPRSLAACLLAVTVFCGLSGCAPEHELAQVTGTVSYQGKPIENGTIVFEVSGYRSSYGQIVNGQIVELRTLEPNDGVPVGNARVAVPAPAPADSGPAAAGNEPAGDAPGGPSGMTIPKGLLPVKYANPETSGLTAMIQSGENEVSFELQ